MMHTASDNGDFLFADESPRPSAPTTKPWRVLVVDDDVEIHRVTRLVLSPFFFKDRTIEILSAYSGVEARAVLAENPDVSVILLDVVMETDDSGLRLVQFVREQYPNRKTRIILRTGQPGYAPELRVLLDYDINDYRAKAESTAERLLTAVAVSLRSYMDIETAEHATAQNQIAQEAVIAKSTFLANMSHELRTPLNAVIGNIELLRLTPLTPRQIDIADSAGMAAHILMDVIGDVLDLSKLEADRFEIDSVPTDLDELLNEIRAVIAPTAATKGLMLRTYIAPDVPQHVATDPSRLRQVIVNLVANAVKFTAVGGVFLNVRVKSRRNGVIVTRFEVYDSGIGFDPIKAAAIFEPFVQAEGSMSRKYGGTGLGLAICRRTVELLGGTIGCSTQPGIGSAFWCEIPLVSTNGHRPAVAPRLDGMSVVVICEAARSDVFDILERHGVKTYRADDLASALLTLAAKSEQTTPILVMRWPLAEGAAVGTLLRLGGHAPIIIAVLESHDDNQVFAATRAGAAHVLRYEHRSELPYIISQIGA